MNKLQFIKMHGIGNDFIVIDKRDQKIELTDVQIITLCNRNKGVGCDQLVFIESPKSDDSDCFVRFYNPDGSQSGACGNASRCVALLLMQENKSNQINIQTQASILNCLLNDNGDVTVNMGQAKTNWKQIPLSHEVDTKSLNLKRGDLQGGFAVNMGNPHAVFFVRNTEDVNFDNCGKQLENDEIFPEKANIGVVEVINKSEINLRVFERGAGETLACGSGACAAVVASYLSDKTSNQVKVNLKGGSLTIKVDESLNVFMTGSATYVFDGQINLDLL